MDIAAWLQGLGLPQYEEAFRANAIDADVLPTLTADDLKDIGVAAVGDRRRLLNAIAALRDGQQDAVAAAETASPAAADAGRSPGAERRQLTVLFCDLVGSTELAGRLDPEDMSALLRAYQDAVAGEVTRFEGHIAKFMGDGVLAYFGWPRAHEDEAERAVRAGLAIQDAIGRLAAPEPLAVRVGIATGLVMVGDLIGEGAAREEAVVGETPNLAAHLQALAEPGTVVIADATRRLLGGLFELENLGAQHLKGLAGPVRALRVLGQSGAESRFEARHGAAPLPLVGREQELALLLDRWARARESEGQVVLLSGEAGIGKSRLMLALRERLRQEPRTSLRYFCSPYHTNSALHPVIAQLERAAGFAREDPPAARLAKLEALLAQPVADAGEATALLAELLALPIEGRERPELTPQQRRARTFQALLAQLEGLAARQPVLMVLEDAHWLDPTSLELFGLTVDRIQHLPALLVVTHRPEFQPPWRGYPHVTTLTLNRLGRAQAEAMVGHLTGGRALPPALLDPILAKTEGVPLFVEELTKTVLESGLVREDAGGYALCGPLAPLAIPATLQDSLMARLDRLGPAKEIAQIGAAIGRTFSHGLVAAIAGRRDVELLPALEELVTSELVFRRGVPPEATYSFKHALVQDAAYESLLRTRRRELHARIAATLEERFSEIVGIEPEVLAHHHSAAGQTEAAFGYWFEAGQRAAERSANQEAIEHLSKGRSALRELPAGPGRDRRELDLLMVLGPAMMAIEGFTAVDAEPLYLRVRELCRELGDNDQDLAAISLRTFYMVQGRLAEARVLGEELLDLGERNQSVVYQFEGHRALGAVDIMSGRLAAARDHLERALAFYDPTQLASFVRQPNGHPGVIALGHLSMALGLLGFADQFEQRSRESLDLAHHLAHPFSCAQAVGISSITNLLCHRVRDAGEAAEALLTLGLEQGFEFWRVLGLGVRGWARTLQGQPQAGVADMRRSMTAAENTGTLILEVWLLAPLAEALGHIGEIQEGLALLDRQRRLAADTGLAVCDAVVRQVEGELRLKLAEPDPGAAETCFQDALAIARRQEARSLELRAAARLARLWQGQGKRAQGRDLLAPVYGWFTEGFETADLVDARELLEQLR